MWKFGVTLTLGAADLTNYIDEIEEDPDNVEKRQIGKSGIVPQRKRWKS